VKIFLLYERRVVGQTSTVSERKINHLNKKKERIEEEKKGITLQKKVVVVVVVEKKGWKLYQKSIQTKRRI
jgi:hypothetical protein